MRGGLFGFCSSVVCNLHGLILFCFVFLSVISALFSSWVLKLAVCVSVLTDSSSVLLKVDVFDHFCLLYCLLSSQHPDHETVLKYPKFCLVLYVNLFLRLFFFPFPPEHILTSVKMLQREINRLMLEISRDVFTSRQRLWNYG